jgi:hypothetical protein
VGFFSKARIALLYGTEGVFQKEEEHRDNIPSTCQLILYSTTIRAHLDACVHLAQALKMQHHGDWLPV